MEQKSAAVNAQNIYLNKLRHDKTEVNVFLIGGARLYGVVKGFDQFTIILEGNGSQTLIFKSGITYITPQKSFIAIKGIPQDE